MPQVNGFQNPGLRFVSPAGGLKGFQRQGMDQRKKAGAGAAVPAMTVVGGAVGTANSAYKIHANTLAGDIIVLLAVGADSSLVAGFASLGTVAWGAGPNPSRLMYRIADGSETLNADIATGQLAASFASLTVRGVTGVALSASGLRTITAGAIDAIVLAATTGPGQLVGLTFRVTEAGIVPPAGWAVGANADNATSTMVATLTSHAGELTAGASLVWSGLTSVEQPAYYVLVFS